MASLTPFTGTNGKLGMVHAKHLLRRAGFLLSKSNIDTFADLSVAQAVTNLLTLAPYNMAEPIDPDTGLPWISTNLNPSAGTARERDYVKAWWLHEAMQDTSIRSKMVFFLHRNFTAASISLGSAYYFDHIALLNHYALGNIKTLALKIIRDNLMSDYLDNRFNEKNNPNENFAREFLELFTIGKGEQIAPGNYTNYTEDDIVEGAKVLTGWRFADRTNPDNIDPDTGLAQNSANFSKHDVSVKTFSSAFQNTVIQPAVDAAGMQTELEEYVDMVFAQDATAQSIVRRIYRFFVSDSITTEVENDIILPLAATFKTNGYELQPLMSELLNSQHFYDEDDSVKGDEIIGGLMKSPLEMVLPTINTFQIAIPDVNTAADDHYNNWYRKAVMDVMFELAGFNFWQPSSVAGYPAYYQEPLLRRNWFNGATLIARYKLPEQLITGKRILAGGTMGGVQIDLVDFAQNSGVLSNVADAQALVTDILNYTLLDVPTGDRFDYFFHDVFLDFQPIANWTTEWNMYLSSGDDSDVRIALERLFKAVLYSPEYQLM